MHASIKLKKKFSPEEDARLKEYVHTYGTSDWNTIAHFFGNRTARQLKDRWENYLDPEVDLHEWTAAEEELLLQMLSLYGMKWRTIANFFKGRTDVHLKNRYRLMKRRERITGSIHLQKKPDENQESSANDLTFDPVSILDLTTFDIPNEQSNDYALSEILN